MQYVKPLLPSYRQTFDPMRYGKNCTTTPDPKLEALGSWKIGLKILAKNAMLAEKHTALHPLQHRPPAGTVSSLFGIATLKNKLTKAPNPRESAHIPVEEIEG